MSIKSRFEQFENEFCQFELVIDKKSQRPDLHAFLLLDQLVPGDVDIVSASEHDEIFLEVDVVELCLAANDSKIRELVRCGAMYHEQYNCLYMFT